MTETDEKPEEKKLTKQGLHGWKAALAMFGCGSLAAFAVFGVVMGVLSSLLSAVSSGVDSEEEPQSVPQPPAEPREEFKSDLFDFCGIVQHESSGRVDFDENPGSIEDSSVDGGQPKEDDLVRSDECSGSLTPQGVDAVSNWDFEFAYEAIIFSPDGDEDELADQKYDRWLTQEENGTPDVLDSGSSALGDQGSYVYGERSEGSGVTYSVVSQKRSAVFRMTFSSGGEVASNSFDVEAVEFNDRLDREFNSLIPE